MASLKAEPNGQAALDGDNKQPIAAPVTDEQTLSALQLSKAHLDAIPRWRVWAAVAILFTCNFLNYADRYTLTAVLTRVEDYFSIDNGQAATATSVFVISYMVVSPFFGYAGDRFDRRPLLFVGILVWCLAILGCTFVKQQWGYGVFLVFRSLCGVGEASYVTVAPTVISDLFSAGARSKVLMVFYFAIPVGTGFGFAVGGIVSFLTDSWQWGLRITPLIGLCMLPLIAFVLPEPPRGLAEAETDMLEGDTGRAQTSFKSFVGDLKHLLFNKTYMLSLVGYTWYVFAIGAFTQWAPIAAIYGQQIDDPDTEWEAWAPTLFGIVTMVAGIVGVACGGGLSVVWIKSNGAADPLLCGLSGLCGVPCLFFAVLTLKMLNWFTWVGPVIESALMVFFGVSFLCFYWSVAMDFLLYIVVPERRSTATAIQILISHALGDAISAVVVGALSDKIRGDQASVAAQFYSLQDALYLPVIFVALGGGMFLFSSWFVETDRAQATLDAKLARNARSRTLVATTLRERAATGQDVDQVIRMRF